MKTEAAMWVALAVALGALTGWALGAAMVAGLKRYERRILRHYGAVFEPSRKHSRSAR